MNSIYFHVDVNNAFLSWQAIKELEKGSDVDLRDIACIITGDPKKRHGIVLAKSQKAKQYGIVTGEPISHAIRKCSTLTMIGSDFELYRDYSKKLEDLLYSYTDDVEKFSIDEFFMYFKNIDDPVSKANNISKKIRETLGFTVNIGISNSKLLSKMAGDLDKPNKVLTLFEHEIEEKLWPLPVESLFLVGRKTKVHLNDMGIKTIYDLAHTPRNILYMNLKSFGHQLHDYANGIDKSIIKNKEPDDTKSVGNSLTIDHDILDIQEINQYLLDLCEKVSKRIRKINAKARTICVHYKNINFETFEKQKSIDLATHSTDTIYKISKELIKSIHKNEPIRAIGVRLQNLIFDSTSNSKKIEGLDKAIDALRNKFGEDIIIRANMLNANLSKVEESSDDKLTISSNL